jgi:hypothetical protein
MVEKWRPVAGSAGMYEVSNLGRVKSMARTVVFMNQFGARCEQAVAEKILTQTRNGRYPTVCLSIGGNHRAYAVHRLVLEAFVGPCPEGMQCRHFPDRDTRNNRLDNLSWGTPVENAADKVAHGTNNDGRKHTPETRARMSRSASRLWAMRRETV